MPHHQALLILLKAFPGIPEAEAKELVTHGTVHSYPPDTILCREDAFESIFYIILEGKVKVTKIISHSEVRELTTLAAGGFFGEMAIIHDAPRAATVKTIEPTTVLEIHKDNFNHMLKRSASISRAMVQEVSQRLRSNDAMAIEDLRLKAGELATAYQQLAEQEYARREFLTTIAHELRTPLTAASGFLQMIQMGLLQGANFDSEAQQNALNNATRNLQQIISLVNDILFVQEMDLILPRFQSTNINSLIKAVVDNKHSAAREARVEILLNLTEDLPQINGDEKSLERAFVAILDNAIKFSPNGGIVEVASGEEDGCVWVEFNDHGVGIPNEALPRIFDRFFHLDQVEDHLFRGAGLGLSIARQVIEQHNGHIKVDSKLGKGTRLQIFLNRSK